MFQLTINFATVEGLQDAVLKLSGEDSNQPQLPLTVPAKTSKAAEKKAAQAAATAEGVAAPAAPAPVKAAKAAKVKRVTLDDLKAKVAEYVDPAKDGDKIKAFARSRGVAKYGDLTEDAIQEAYAAVDEYFTTGEGAEGGDTEEDPMD